MSYTNTPIEEPEKKEDVERLEFRLNELKSDVAVKQEEMKERKKKVEAAQKEMKETVAKRNALQAKLDAKEKKAKEMEGTLQGMADFESTMRNTTNEQIGENQRALADLKSTLAQKTAHLASLTAQYHAATTTHTALLAEKDAAHATTLATLNASLNQAAENKEQVTSKAAAVAERYTDQLTGLKSSLNKHTTSSPAKKKRKGGRVSTATASSVEIIRAEHQEEATERETLVAALKADLKRKNDAIKKTKANLASLDGNEKRLAEVTAELAGTKKKVAEELGRLNADLQELQRVSMMTADVLAGDMAAKMKGEVEVLKKEVEKAVDVQEIAALNVLLEQEKTKGDAELQALKALSIEDEPSAEPTDNALQNLRERQQALKKEVKLLEAAHKAAEQKTEAEKQTVRGLTAKLVLADPSAGHTIPKTPRVKRRRDEE